MGALHYDAAIIGAGADGLAAAITLAKSGLKIIVLERNEKPGGRCITREFHPGFHASPFCDEVSPIPAEIFWALDLARYGALFMPSPVSTALWPDRAKSLRSGESRLRSQSAALAKSALFRSEADTAARKKSLFPSRTRSDSDSWPGDIWAVQSLVDLLVRDARDSDSLALSMASTLEGHLAHPDLAGSALHLLASEDSGQPVGGLQNLTNALLAATQIVGAEISCGLEVTDILRRDGRTNGLRLADGAEIAVRAIISTLDLKRTFLSLFAWNDLPAETSRRVRSFRMNGGTARLLFALDSLPERPAFAAADVFCGPIYVAPSVSGFGSAYAAWRTGIVAEHLPITLRFTSAKDPRLCPVGAATLMATVDGVPPRLFDDSWTHEKRDALRGQVLDAIECVLPGIKSRVRACELMVPPDIEQALGYTDGDLWGGEIAADQMLAFRPWLDCAAPRTPIEGLYLAGPSTTAGILATCASGVFAARAVAADFKAGRLK